MISKIKNATVEN